MLNVNNHKEVPPIPLKMDTTKNSKNASEDVEKKTLTRSW